MTRPKAEPGGPAGEPAGPPRVAMAGIVKRFGDVVANDAADLELAAGEIHALVGENGAGKSTLMSVLYGLVAPDGGEIRVDGRPVRFRSPVDAVAAGMGMVHQAFRLFPSMTVAENVVYRAETRGTAGLLDRKAAVRAVQDLSERYGLRSTRARGCAPSRSASCSGSRSSRRCTATPRCSSSTSRPRCSRPQETRLLFDVLRGLRDAGRTVVIVTHKLGEVLELSDNVTVLRDGRTVARLVTAETDRRRDRPPHDRPGRRPRRPLRRRDAGRAGAAGRGPHRGPPNGRPVVDDVSLSVRSGEIVGIAGVAGNGQVELLEAIAGLRPARAGSVRVGGTALDGLSAGRCREAGIAYIPEDRAATGSAVAASVADNLAVGFHRRRPLRRGWRLDRSAVRRPRPRDHRALRDQGEHPVGGRRHPVGRQPAEAGRGPGDGP